MTLTSRYFGIIDPSALGDAATTATINTKENRALDVSLLIADPPHLRQEQLDQADAALDYFDQLDERVRATILLEVSDPHSIPGQIYGTLSALDPVGDLTPEEFTQSLRVSSAVVAPDGGSQSPDRVSITFVSTTKFMTQSFMAIVREGFGFVFVATDEAQRSESSLHYR